MPDTKHIAFYITSLAKGGVEREFINLASYLHDAEYQITFVTTYLDANEYVVPHAAWREIEKEEAVVLGEDAVEVMRPDESSAWYTEKNVLQEEERGIHRTFSGLTPKEKRRLQSINFSKRTQLLRKTWERIQPDLIISADAKNNVMVMLSSIGMNIPVIVYVSSNPATEYASRQLYLSMAATFPRAAAVAVQMQGQADFFPPKVREKTVVLRNILDQVFLRPPYEGEREKTIVSIGKLNHNKNHQMLIKAFARVLPKYPDWKLLIYGEGNERRHLTQLIATLGLRDSVELKGYMDHIEDVLYQAGIFVLCSNEEGMPDALLEAMALGVPCIATDCPCGGPKEIVKDGFNGLLTPVGDVARMETALIRFLGNRGLMKSCGLKAAEILKKYAPEIACAEWKRVIEDVLEPKELQEESA